VSVKEGGDFISVTKMGRPLIDNPKDIKFSIRLDKTTSEKLDEYCKRTNQKRAEAIREGIGYYWNDSNKKEKQCTQPKVSSLLITQPTV